MKQALYTLALFLSATNFVFAECIFHRPIEIRELSIGNLLTWSTSTEHGNKKFYVEKSTDGVTFEEVGELDGAGDSQVITDYRFLDLKIGADEAFYRLKMVDASEYESITHTIFFNRENANNYVFRSMSSPTTDSHFTIVMDSKVEGKLRYRVVNQKNNVILSKSRYVSPGEHLISVNLTEFGLGSYKLQTFLNNEKEEVNIRRVKTESLPNIQYVIK